MLCLLGSLGAASSIACLSIDRDLIGTQEGCDELESGELETVPDVRVRALVAAAIDFDATSAEMRDAVRDACAGIAADLGAPNSWNDIDDVNERITNEDGTGACDVAGVALTALLERAADAGVAIGLAVSEGVCLPDVETQIACEQGCTHDLTCEPGPIEERCAADALSVQCQGACPSAARCAGALDQPANCVGFCASTCEGACEGSCIAPDGTVTENDPSCAGKCAAICSGSCSGMCLVQTHDGVECGADIACLGGCTGAYAEPKCAGELSPPACDVGEDCYASCAASAAATAACALPQVDIYADLTAMADGALEVLAATLEENLPVLLWAGESYGPRARVAVERLTVSAISLLHATAGKSRVCAGTAGGAIVSAMTAVATSVDASAALANTCRTYME